MLNFPLPVADKPDIQYSISFIIIIISNHKYIPGFCRQVVFSALSP